MNFMKIYMNYKNLDTFVIYTSDLIMTKDS